MLVPILIAICVVEFVALCAIGIIYFYKKNSKKIVKEKKGVRYTVSDEVVNKEGRVQATLVEGDILMPADEIFKVGKDKQIKPGRYNILSTQSGKQKVTLVVNDVRRNQEHNSEIIFAEGDIVIAEHESVILR